MPSFAYIVAEAHCAPPGGVYVSFGPSAIGEPIPWGYVENAIPPSALSVHSSNRFWVLDTTEGETTLLVKPEITLYPPEPAPAPLRWFHYIGYRRQQFPNVEEEVVRERETKLPQGWHGLVTLVYGEPLELPRSHLTPEELRRTFDELSKRPIVSPKSELAGKSR